VANTIGIGADDAALELKQTLVEHLKEKGYEVQDYSPPSKEEAQSAEVDYPDVAVEVAEAVARGEHERAILVCGTGVGMSITANKVPGVRAARCHDVFSAKRARKSNDAQVLTMGQRMVRPELAKTVVDAWLESEFGGLVGEEGPEDGKGGTPIPPGRRDDLLSNPCA